jgi:hypothetical protein
MARMCVVLLRHRKRDSDPPNSRERRSLDSSRFLRLLVIAGVRRIQNEFGPQEQRTDSAAAWLHDLRQPHFGAISWIAPVHARSIGLSE